MVSVDIKLSNSQLLIILFFSLASTSKKRKSTLKEEAAAATTTKKDKKPVKKEKIPTKKSKEAAAGSPEKHATVANKSSSSLRDYFAEELLEKAKQDINTTAEISQNIKKGKNKTVAENSDEDGSSDVDKETQDFDIPTISEISSTTEAVSGKAAKDTVEPSGNREKDLAELAEIQKKIYAAKKQLKQIGELEEDDEYDEDFITIGDDESREAFSESRGKSPATPPTQKQRKRVKSPIVFDHDDKVKAKSDDDNSINAGRMRFTPPLAAVASDFRGTSTAKDEVVERPKRPVHERLGLKPPGAEPQKPTQHVSRERRRNVQEKELYVPAFRRKELDREREMSRERDRTNLRDRGRDRERESDRRQDRSRENDASNLPRGRSRVRRSIEDREKKRPSSENNPEPRSGSQVGKISTTTVSSSSPEYSPEINASRKRIGSRVIVAPVKVLVPSDEEDISEKPVNSIIKIKPRTPVSPSKQAPKNLLLRAVAEAQKSTFLKAQSAPGKPKISTRLGDKVLPERSTKLYTKSYRDRRKTTSGVGAIFTRTAQNLIVEVNGSRAKDRYAARQDTDNEEEEEEYVPEVVSDRGESEPDLIYVPQTIKQRPQRDEDGEEENWSTASQDSCYEHIDLVEAEETQSTENTQNTQFVVTLNGMV